jgi:protein TonB
MSERPLGSGVALSAALHLLAVLCIRPGTPASALIRHETRRPMIEIEPPAPAPAPPPSPPALAESNAPALRTDPPKAPRRERKRQPSSPARGTAAPPPAILTAQDLPDAPVDMTDSVLVGTAATVIGGEVRSGASGDGTGAGVRASVPIEERSSRPTLGQPVRLLGDPDWACPFPREAEADGTNHAEATLRIDVDREGLISRVTVVDAPKAEFGREAEACARRRRWAAARNPEGFPIAGSIAVRLRFDR